MFINYDNIICIGDLNYDLLIKEKSKPLTNICDNFNLQCMVKEPTCFTKNQTPNLIDVILTNSKTLLCNTVNFNCGLSDCHNMIATSLRESCNKTEKKKVTFRSYKNFDEAQLNDDLSRVPFQVAHTFDMTFIGHMNCYSERSSRSMPQQKKKHLNQTGHHT